MCQDRDWHLFITKIHSPLKCVYYILITEGQKLKNVRFQRVKHCLSHFTYMNIISFNPHNFMIWYDCFFSLTLCVLFSFPSSLSSSPFFLRKNNFIQPASGKIRT